MIRKLNPLYGLLPHSGVSTQNPLFAYGARRMRWWYRARGNVFAHSLWTFCILLGAALSLVVIMLGIIFASLLINGVGYSIFDEPLLMRDLSRLLRWALIGGLLAGPALDFVFVGITLYHLISGRSELIGDMLHVTLLTSESVADAQHALARLRTWQFTLALVAWRAMLLVIYIVGLAVGGGRLNYLPTVSGAAANSTLRALAILAVLVVITIEPLWRSRAVTALGVTLATRFKSLFAALFGGAMIVLLLLTVPQLLLIPPYLRTLGIMLAGSTIDHAAALVSIALVTLCIYGAYFSLENVALRRAQQYMFQEGRD